MPSRGNYTDNRATCLVGYITVADAMVVNQDAQQKEATSIPATAAISIRLPIPVAISAAGKCLLSMPLSKLALKYEELNTSIDTLEGVLSWDDGLNIEETIEYSDHVEELKKEKKIMEEQLSDKEKACVLYRKLFQMRSRLSYMRENPRYNFYTYENLSNRCDEIVDEIHGLGFEEEDLHDCIDTNLNKDDK